MCLVLLRKRSRPKSFGKTSGELINRFEAFYLSHRSSLAPPCKSLFSSRERPLQSCHCEIESSEPICGEHAQKSFRVSACGSKSSLVVTEKTQELCFAIIRQSEMGCIMTSESYFSLPAEDDVRKLLHSLISNNRAQLSLGGLLVGS